MLCCLPWRVLRSDAEVLSLFAAIINKLQGLMEPEVPRVFEAVFECTLTVSVAGRERARPAPCVPCARHCHLAMPCDMDVKSPHSANPANPSLTYVELLSQLHATDLLPHVCSQGTGVYWSAS